MRYLLISIASALIFLSGCRQEQAAGSPGGGLLDSVVDRFSSRVKAAEDEVASLRAQLQELPEISPDQQTVQLGYHSKPLERNAATDTAGSLKDSRFIWLDLGSQKRIDQIVLVPVDYTYGGGNSAGYGFPPGFRVEVSNDRAFEESALLADFTLQNLPSVRRYPVIITAGGTTARYVRLTTSQLWEREGRSLLALAEVLVLRGGQNLAAGLPAANLRSTDTDDSPPTWSRQWLVDGQSLLGAPLTPEAAPTEGWQSIPFKNPDATSWLMLDLGREYSIEELRLIPARAGEYPSRRGFGFPVRFKVESSHDAFFSQPEILADWTNRDFASPNENPVSFRGTLPARFIRITATRMSERLDDFVFALAEVEVYSGGEKISDGATVTTSSSRETGIWSTRFVTDGYSSQRRLSSWPDFLSRLDTRRQLDLRLRERLSTRRALVTEALRSTLFWSLGIVAIAVISAVFMIWRSVRTRRLEVAAIQRRLAQDFHDEIGSGLGTISLLSQMGWGNAEHPAAAREDFGEVHRLSREVTESLRDIVWFIRSPSRTVGDLALRLRETTDAMLAAIPHDFETDSDALSRELPIEHKRQVLLFFKEALHNVQRHSAATHTAVRVGGTMKSFRLLIADNGRGFNSAEPRSGAGVTGMTQRAKTLGGSLKLQTGPGKGTTLILEVPWPKKGRGIFRWLQSRKAASQHGSGNPGTSRPAQ